MSDVYKIGVQLALTGNMAEGLGLIASKLTGIERQTESLMAKWDKLGSNLKLALGGAVATGAGLGIFDGIAKLVEKGADFVHVQQQLLAATQNQKDVAEATAIAWREASRYGLNVSQVLGDIKEARMVFGSTEHAMEFIDPLEKMRVVLNAMTEGRGDTARDAVYQMARAGELKGLQRPEDFVDYFDKMTQAITASGGKVDPSSFMMATQYGKIASKGWNEEFYTKILPSMIQEMRPSTAGQSLMSLYNTLVAGHMSIPAMNAAMDLGLIGDPTKVQFNKITGAVKRLEPGALLESNLMTANPFKWAQDVMKPLVEKKLGRGITGPDDAGALDILTNIFGNRNSAAAIATLLNESTRINKDANLVGQAKGLSAADDLLKNDPNTAAANFKNSWNNLLQALGSPMVQPAINAMNSLANVFKSITNVAAANPELVKRLGTDAAVAGGVLTAGGIGAMGLAMFNFMTGKGGLMGSAAALNTSATMLQSAAVSLGAKGIPGVAGGIPPGESAASGMGKLFTAMAVLPFLGEAWQSFQAGAADYYAKYGGGSPQTFGRGGAALNGGGRKRNPFAAGQPGLGPDGFHPGSGADEPGFWFNRDALHKGYVNQGGTVNAAPPTVNVAPPNVQTQVNVTIDGQQLRAIVTQIVKSAIGSMGGFSTGSPTPNTGTMPPAVDGATGN